MSDIRKLPIELWNIILTYSDLKGSKNLIYICHIYKLFNSDELSCMNKKYIYDYIIASSLLNINIYKLYNTLETINTKSKYINVYAKFFKEICFLDKESITLEKSLILRNHLESKISDSQLKQKFNNLTHILVIQCKNKNNEFSKMLHYL